MKVEVGRSPTGRAAVRVLVVDDDEDVRRLLDMIFEIEGFEVVGVVEDGAEAVPAAFETQPDVVILDLMMPNIDGAEAARFLRIASPHSRIIAFSGVVSKKPDWADDYLQKGGVSRLGELVRHVMDGPDAAPPPPPVTKKLRAQNSRLAAETA